VEIHSEAPGRHAGLTQLTIIGLTGIPEVQPGADLVEGILAASRASETPLMAGDILVVTQKIVSKAEGQIVHLSEVTPSPFAEHVAIAMGGRDPRHIEVVLRETARIVRMDRGVLITETHHGFVCANAGVDASNAPAEGTLCLLPRDPDASAQRLHQGLLARLGFAVPVIISDSFGRPWRNGITNIAIGVAGLNPLADYRGQKDPQGYELKASVLAVADELAAAAELVAGKISGRPVAIIRGYAYPHGEGRGRDLLMDPARDLFR
jgi:coenzyme F420-0:L-glutamate ligase/coenzyme F420-1:gamma-L-glutamate ligase